MRVILSLVCVAATQLGVAGFAAADAVQVNLARLKAVGSEGAGNAEAAVAWKALVASGIDGLMPTLSALDEVEPVSANWLRLAAQAIVENEQRAKRPLPAEKLENFLKDTRHAPISRRLAYEFLVEADPNTPERLLPGMVEDTSVEIRRDAIAAAIEKASPLLKSDPKKASLEFERLFHASRDQDQAEKIVKILKELNVDSDLNKHFGVLSQWMLIGPFDSTMGAGFPKAYEPETKIDLNATYVGKCGMNVKWQPHASTEKYGAVDLNKALDKHKDAAIYAFTVVESDKELPIEIRFGSMVAVKVFVNGKELFAREEYHHGDRFDQYRTLGVLKPGRNELLVKVCQNNQTESWAQDCKFQLRLCDATGGAVPVKVMPINGPNK